MRQENLMKLQAYMNRLPETGLMQSEKTGP